MEKTISVFGEGGEKMFAFDDDICVLKDLEEGIAEPLGEFVKRHKRFEAFY
jgi:hypothetical protein